MPIVLKNYQNFVLMVLVKRASKIVVSLRLARTQINPTDVDLDFVQIINLNVQKYIQKSVQVERQDVPMVHADTIVHIMMVVTLKNTNVQMVNALKLLLNVLLIVTAHIINHLDVLIINVLHHLDNVKFL